MELHDFAEQVLFATILDDKLQSPAVVTDERPGSPLLTPQAPGRPAELRFKPQGSGKAGFPGVHHLDQEHERGRLLHFFANHELLATELMALALLLWGGSSRGIASLICFSHFCLVQWRVALHSGSSPLAERRQQGLA